MLDPLIKVELPLFILITPSIVANCVLFSMDRAKIATLIFSLSKSLV